MKLDVSVIGLLNIDLIVRGSAPKNIDDLLNWMKESEIECLVAGACGYLIQNLAKLGLKTGVITNIADDEFGLIIQKKLKDLNIDTKRLKIQKNTKSAIALFMLLFGNNKRPMTFRMMTHEPIPKSFSKEDLEYVFSSRLLHHAGYLHYPNKEITLDLFKKVKEQGLKISMDPQFPLYPLDKPWLNAFNGILEYIDILFVNKEEALGLTDLSNLDEAATKLLKCGPEIVAVKLGADGCIIYTGNQCIKKPAIPVENIIDTIGAGDAFDTGFIVGYLEGLSLEKTINLALKVASYSLQGLGGSSSIPKREDIKID
ncbi:MAG: carbohydrate kinase family protein [Promethearchaeota archaeon]